MRRSALVKSETHHFFLGSGGRWDPQSRFDAWATDDRPIEDQAADNLLEETLITPMSVGFFVETLDECTLP